MVGGFMSGGWGGGDIEGAERARGVVSREVASRAFLDFAAGHGTRPHEKRIVAIASADRLRQVGLGPGDRDHAVHLSAETVATHPRFAGFSAEDWQRVQRIIDRGEWVASGTTHRLFWLEDAGKPWLTVLKRTKAGEIYLQSYRRASRRKIRKLRKGT